MKIREARKTDAEEFAKLFLDYTKEEEKFCPIGVWNKNRDKKIIIRYFNRELKNKKRIVLLAVNNGIKGFLIGGFEKLSELYKSRSLSLVNELYIDPSFRKKGASSALKKEFFKISKKRGAKAAYLFVAINNKALNIYKKWGFEKEYTLMVKKLK